MEHIRDISDTFTLRIEELLRKLGIDVKADRGVIIRHGKSQLDILADDMVMINVKSTHNPRVAETDRPDY